MTPLRPVLAAVALVAAVCYAAIGQPATPEPAPTTTTVATITHIDGPATATAGADRCGTTEVAP
jgi:hypothetical protein